jgi:hypothetical protein
MAQLRTIEIDLDIHKLIEAERKSFDEAPYTALRRLLRLDTRPPGTGTNPTDGEPWSGEGVTLPHGTLFRIRYDRGRQLHTGAIRDGLWHIGDAGFSSPSGAAAAVVVTKKGKSTRINGWDYMEVKRPLDLQWINLGELRKPKLTLEELGL